MRCWPPSCTFRAPVAALWSAPRLADRLGQAQGGDLALGAPEGYLRMFLDEGPPMASLFRQPLADRRQERPAAAGATREYLARLADTFEQAGLPIRAPVGRGVVVAGLVKPLTARELAVLQLLAAGASNRSIAEQLVVTLETVKSTSATCSTSWRRPTGPRP
jgi:ATP/maltotriose-dependent transcriptional regulator MalT